MIRRDAYGIIVQQDGGPYGDGGDSCMKTGVMATCGSVQDQLNLSFFNRIDAPRSGILTRHPYQVPWNNPNNFTRDQLICWMAGAKTARFSDSSKQVLMACIKRGFRAQNTEYDYPGTVKKFPNGPDILSPSDMFFIGYCANINIVLLCLLATVGIPWFILSLIVATRVNPQSEQNQMICQCIIYGRFATKLYVKLHKSWKQVTIDYWGGWRDQAEIGHKLIDTVLMESR